MGVKNSRVIKMNMCIRGQMTHGQINWCFTSGAPFTSGHWNPVSKYESWESWENQFTTGK